MEHWFWTIFAVLVLCWYIVVTAIVAFKGGKNIRDMIHGWRRETPDTINDKT